MHFLTSLIKFALWNWGRPKRLKLFNKEAGRGHGGSVPGRPHRVQFPQLRRKNYSSILRRNRCGTRKETKLGIEKLIINAAEELSFRRLGFKSKQD